MSFQPMYVSKPGVSFPKDVYDNDAIIEKVRNHFKGTEEEFSTVKSAIQRVFDVCNTRVRYLDFNTTSRVADYAASAAKQCLERAGIENSEIDLVVFGGIARQYFEPATAMEIAATLGLKEIQALDVTTACVGHLEALHTAIAYLNMHDELKCALVCTAELSRGFLDFDIQSTKDLYTKSAGLTVGNAAACFLVCKEPFKGGCINVKAIKNYSVPIHWGLCQVPIDGKFFSSSVELMKLHKYIAPRIKKFLAESDLKPEEVDHFIFHQPSETMTRKIISKTGADEARGIYTHHLYGNNASASVGVVYDHLLKERDLSQGDIILLGSAAAGFAMTVAAGTWVA